MLTAARISILVLILAGVSVVPAVLTPSSAEARPPTDGAETLTIDPVHTSVHFRVKHMSASWFQGRFNDVSGKLVFDAADPAKCSVEVVVKTESVDSRTERLDGHLKSPDFLNAAQFPLLTFKSIAFKKAGDSTYEVAGKLTLRGVTKDLTVTAEHVGTSEIRGKRIGFSTSFTINRRDFKVNYGTEEMVGDEVTIFLDLETVKE